MVVWEEIPSVWAGVLISSQLLCNSRVEVQNGPEGFECNNFRRANVGFFFIMDLKL